MIKIRSNDLKKNDSVFLSVARNFIRINLEKKIFFIRFNICSLEKRFFVVLFL